MENFTIESPIKKTLRNFKLSFYNDKAKRKIYVKILREEFKAWDLVIDDFIGFDIFRGTELLRDVVLNSSLEPGQCAQAFGFLANEKGNFASMAIIKFNPNKYYELN